MNRRDFIKAGTLAGSAGLLPAVSACTPSPSGPGGPVVCCTWDFGEVVPRTAYEILENGGSLLDAVEAGAKIPEADPMVTSVGRGGAPDREGIVTLDACIMDGRGNCGAVVFLEKILHPVSVARAVMEKTPHVMLAGAGALQFALEQGFSEEELLTPEAKKAYEDWLATGTYKPASASNHDTIGMLALSEAGTMAGACTTSGMAYKVRGRVGDSPIIGAGLFVDDEVGGATATGIGEAVIKVAGSHTIVELMRQGRSPHEACRMALQRILDKQPQYRQDEGFLVGFLALDRLGNVGGVSYRKGFQYAIVRGGVHEVIDAEYMA
jgi:isoaspartyl peptidase/L-asparaginase-like protein (Ntn-hydrolase superfamily)